MKKHLRTSLLTSALGASFALPLLASAQVNLSKITPYSDGLINLINNILVPVLMAIAFIVFIWGIYKYFIYGAAEEKSQTEGRQLVLWGLIGFVIILSLWGIVNLFMSTLGLSAGTVPPYPKIGNGTGASSSGGSLNLGTGAQIGGSGVSGTVTIAQQNAAASLAQTRTAMQDTCAQYGASSPSCIAITANYNQALTKYNNDYPTSGNGTSAVGGAAGDHCYVGSGGCNSGLECVDVGDGQNGVCTVPSSNANVGGLTCSGFCKDSCDSGTETYDANVQCSSATQICCVPTGNANSTGMCTNSDADNYGQSGPCSCTSSNGDQYTC